MTLVSLRRARVALLIVVGVVLAFGLAPTAAAQSSADVELGLAPSRDESQDIGNWVYRAIPKAAKSRAEVAQLYNTQFVPGNAVVLNWTGSLAGCVVGTTNADHQQAVIARINYFRALADLPAVVLEDATPTAQVQSHQSVPWSASRWRTGRRATRATAHAIVTTVTLTTPSVSTG